MGSMCCGVEWYISKKEVNHQGLLFCETLFENIFRHIGMSRSIQGSNTTGDYNS